jgi:cysteine desulfuration protein SufE
VARLALIENPQERLAAVVDRARKRPPLDPAFRTDTHRVQGCVSKVWLVGRLEQGRCRFELDAESVLVRGLALLICDVYDGLGPEEILAHPTAILDALQLRSQLSPTRQNGLDQVRQAIQAFAAQASGA